MADKRAMDRKWVAEPYDMDTALGINNSGILSYGYSLQDTDQVDAEIAGGDDQGSKDVFNAQNSVLWMNIRDAYRDQIVSMYQSLRSGGKFNYSYIEQYFENHQSKWPEALVNEDSYVKYITPLIKPVTEEKDEVTGKTIFVTTSKYLKMLLGLKTQQRRRWLYNRFRFMDSKYLLGDAAANTIGMRLFHDGTLTVTPALDLYVSVRFGLGSTPRQVQATAGTPIDFAFENPSGTKDMETVIYSADLITDLGDLSVFYPNEIDLSYATRLRRLKIGSGEEGYSNGRLNTINISNKPVLEYLDLRNCPNLAEGFDLEGSPRLEEAYFDGTAITGVDLAEGCSIEHLHLPDTITALTLMDLDKLTDLQLAGLGKVERCMIRNVNSSVADPISIVEQLQPGTLVYLEGIDIELADAAAIDEFLDFLDTMKGVTRTRGSNGRWAYTETEKAQVSGKIHTDSLTGAEIVAFNERYPYIEVTADHTTGQIYYHNWEANSAVIAFETVADGADAINAPTGVTHESTPQYTFEFLGWSRTPESTSIDPDALKKVTADRHVYAVYKLTVRKYTVKFIVEDDTTQNKTFTNVAYGRTVSYGSTDPYIPDDEDAMFIGWTPTPSVITGDVTYYASFRVEGSQTRQLITRTIREFEDTSELCTEIGKNSFYNCTKLTTVVLPVATNIGDNAFSSCGRLTSIIAPNVTNIGHSVFVNDSNLSDVDLSSVTEIGSQTFTKTGIKSITFQNLVTLHANGKAFSECAQLERFEAPMLTTLPYNVFYKCTALTTVDVSSVASIAKAAFEMCTNLSKLIIRTQQVATLENTNAFSGVNSVNIYVPDALVEDYKSATNWSTFADKIKSLSEIGEI